MADVARRLRALWRRITRPDTVVVGGVRIATSPSLPRNVRIGLYKERYEAPELALIARVLRPGQRVLEIGAGIGLVGLAATRVCGPGRVTSYEANPRLEPVIRDNYALNGLVPDLHMRAVTVDGSPISFFRSDNIVSSSVFDRENQGERITVASEAIDAVIARVDPEVIVIDVEGAEVDLLARPAFGRVHTIVAELHPHIVGAEAIASLIATLATRGFALVEERHGTALFERRAG